MSGYRHISDANVRALFEKDWGVQLDPEPGLRIPNMFDAAIDGSYKALYIQGEDVVQSDPNTQHVEHAMASLECVVVQDLFLNETAKFAHVFLPGTTFLEKDGTFTNSQGRVQRIRKVLTLKGDTREDWRILQSLGQALGVYAANDPDPERIFARLALAVPAFSGLSYAVLGELGAPIAAATADVAVG